MLRKSILVSPWQGTPKIIIMIMMMLRKSILVSPWQASPGAVNLLLVHYNVFQHTDDEDCHNFLLLSFMLIRASAEYEWRRRKQWDYWIFCELGQRRWYDEIIWLANPGSWPGGEYNQQKLYKVIRGKRQNGPKIKKWIQGSITKDKNSVLGGKLCGPWTWHCKILPSHWSRAGLHKDHLVARLFVFSSAY